MRAEHFDRALERYHALYLTELDRQDSDMLLLGTDDQMRQGFESFASEKLEASGMEEAERRDALGGFMRAYDRARRHDASALTAYIRI